MTKTADIQTQPFYLKKAKLKGYKSIKDAEVEFCEGLNIIIGKNASGKSNLMEVLFDLISFEDEYLFNINAELTIQGLKELELKTNFINKNKFELNPFLKNKKANFKIDYDGQTIKESYLILGVNYIKYNIPEFKNSPIIGYPFNFKFDSYRKSKEIDEIWSFSWKFYLFMIHQIVNFRLLDDSPDRNIGKLDVNKVKENLILRIHEKILGLNKLLNGLVPIEEIRFNPHFNIYFEKESGITTFSNVFIEYRINGNWLPFSSLSDGTKRLFYIISEFYFGSYADYVNYNGDFNGENIRRNIFLFEEPELGIHPHQLHRLMTFIKEQSRDKQIILSTHSPMVLDVLGKDDLHRIIIASNDDPKKGSQFRHLTEKEMDKARLYMDDDYLSDYWKYSDLER